MAKGKLKDHRQIAQEQELFFIDENVGVGLPMWLPSGATVRRILERYMTDLEIEEGYQHVVTPHLAKLALYKKSGHWQHYKEGMFPPIKRAGEEYILRPMNCPHHIEIYASRPRSYRELPLRIAEFGTLYRWEHSGELTGLMRVRSMSLNDAHIFCSQDQLKDEFIKVVGLIERVYKDLNLKNFWYRLSLYDPRDKKKYVDAPSLWKASEHAIKEALKDSGLHYEEAKGEAAFYGPKLDVQIPNLVGRDETVSTVQVDFHLPEKFNLSYIGEDGKKHPVVIIHRAVVSTLERIVAFLTEQYQGAFPVWLSPVQAVVLPITDRNLGYAQEITGQLKSEGLRVNLDDRPQTLQAKIRDAQLQKIPYMLVVGDKEEKGGVVALRLRTGEDLGSIKIEEVIKRARQVIEEKKDL